MKSISDNRTPSWQLKRREWRVALVLLAALIVGVLLPQRIIVATSDSLDHRIFFKVPVPDRIEPGDYLLFRLQGAEHKQHIRQGLKPNDVLIKKVGCVPGNILTRDGEGTFYCDQNTLGRALAKDSKGNEMPVFSFIGAIPEGRYFMMGTSPRSFDSRYFGFIHADEFLSKALPLW